MSQYDPHKWDHRFLDMAGMVAGWSKDPTSKIGAVIVRPDRTVASLGFNGFPRGLEDHPHLYANRDFKIATVIHAEENAIISSKDQSLFGCTLYVSGLPPCAGCASKIIQSGISRVVAHHKLVPARWVQNMSWALENLRRSAIEVETYEPGTLTWRTILEPGDLWLEDAPETAVPATCGCAA